MGKIIPIMAVKTIPGDTWKLSHELVIRLHPPAAPMYHEVQATIHYFDIPLRILWDKFERYYTGGKLGNDSSVMPRWQPLEEDKKKGSLWDYFGFPINFRPADPNWNTGVPQEVIDSYNYDPPSGDLPNLPTDLLRRAYNVIWDEYYRDVDIQDAQNPDPNDPAGEPTRPANFFGNNRSVLRRAWRKDYFTSARIDRTRGTPPALPIYGEASAFFTHDARVGLWRANPLGTGPIRGLSIEPDTSWMGAPNGYAMLHDQTIHTDRYSLQIAGSPSGAQLIPLTRSEDLNRNTISLENMTSVDIADLRLAVQTQKWMERNMRGGSRFTEVIRAHFDEAPTDERLDRPKYIGGSKHNVEITEIVQTSGTMTDGTPQGTMCGHGLCADESYITEYRVKEPSIIMGLLSIMPKSGYEDGINRQWLSSSRFEEYWAEYANLSEQGIYNVELYPQGGNPEDAEGNPVRGGDLDLWGYQGRYDEYRTAKDYASSEMRVKTALVCEQGVQHPMPSLGYWHMLRSFSSLPGLNSEFIQCAPDKRWMSVRGMPPFEIDEAIVNYHCKSVAIRPMPPIAEPGLMDHH
jgi:hypothetical protein